MARVTRWWLRYGLAALVAALGPSAAAQRVVVAGDLGWRSEYLWRGLVRVNGPLLEADVYATVSPAARWVVSGGGWWGRQLRGVPDSAFGDRSTAATIESSPWLQLARRIGATDLALGAMRYNYYGEIVRPYARASARNTTELYARAVLDGRRVGGATTLWWDVDRVRGLYLETTATLNLPLMPIPLPLPLGRLDPMFGNVFVDLTAGWNLSQDPAAGSFANFAGRGLTHVDIGISTAVLIREFVSVDFSVHAQAARDAAARRITPQRDAALNTWLAVTLRPLCLICGRGRR
jgi:hypothetical protein